MVSMKSRPFKSPEEVTQWANLFGIDQSQFVAITHANNVYVVFYYD